MVGLTDRSTLNWAKQNRLRSGWDRFESLLIARGATHYIDTRSEESPTILKGKKLIFTVLFDIKVNRDIMNSDKPVDTVWRVYEVKEKDSPQSN